MTHTLFSCRRVRRTAAIGAILLFQWLLSSVSLADQLSDERAFWAAANAPGSVVLMRHALAPGTGDPDRFSEADCDTQRNLSQRGREQAARIGDALRKHAVRSMAVYSSAWCRCLDTATLLDVGAVEKLPPLNSFFRQWEREQAQTTALIDWLAQRESADLPVLVTHQVNITALSGVYPASGEMVVVRMARDNASVEVLGRLVID